MFWSDSRYEEPGEQADHDYDEMTIAHAALLEQNGRIKPESEAYKKHLISR